MRKMQTPEERIENLARTLRASGLALSDSQAKIMAQDIVSTETKVQKDYSGQHQQVDDLLTRRSSRQAEETPSSGPSFKEDIKGQVMREMRKEAMSVPVKHDEIDVTRPLNDLIKEDNPDAEIPAMEMPEAQIAGTDAEEPYVPIAPIEQPEEEAQAANIPEAEEQILEAEESPAPIAELEFPSAEEPIPEVPAEDGESQGQPEGVHVIEEQEPEPAEVQEDEVKAPEPPYAEEMKEEELHEEKIPEEKAPESTPDTAGETPGEEEEDPNQPEKTRVYTDKPANPKPKESFEENKIDLSNIFNFRK